VRTTIALCAALGAFAALALAFYALNESRRARAAHEEVAARLAQLRSEASVNDYHAARSARTLAALAAGANVPWHASADGKVSARLLCDRPVTLPNQSVWLVLEVRNDTDAALVVDAPRPGPWDLVLYHEGRRIPYAGPVPSMPPPGSLQLPPAGVHWEVVELTPASFPALSHKGVFTAEYTYRSGVSPRPAPTAAWSGEIRVPSFAWVSR
jgi:hypothetical protein